MIRLGDQDEATRNSILAMLEIICSEADLKVAPDGTVEIGNADACTEEFARSHCGCRCLCQLVKAARTVTIQVHAARAAAGGGGLTIDANEEDTVNGRGSDETVYIDNRNLYAPQPDWLILAHELCGHALPGMLGTHVEWRRGQPGFKPDWHQQAIEVENEIRREHGLPLR